MNSEKFFSLLIFLLFMEAASGQMSEQPMNDEPILEKDLSVIDSTHKSLSTSLFYLSDHIDAFFGGERSNDLPNASRLRFLLNFNKEESSPYKTKGAVKLNIALVETQKKLKISFKNKYEKSHEQTSNEKKSETNDKNDQNQAIENFETEVTENNYYEKLKELFKWRIRVDSGIQLDFPPDPFLRFSAIKSATFGNYELRATQQFFYYLKSKAGETTKLDIDRPISENVLFRYENDLTWTDNTDKFTFFSGPIIYQKINDERGISYNAKIFGESKPTWFVNDYRIEITYRRSILKKWLFMELNPYVHFPKGRDWESTLGFNLRFELVVGRY